MREGRMSNDSKKKEITYFILTLETRWRVKKRAFDTQSMAQIRFELNE